MKQGWEIKKLGEVMHIARGGSPRPIKKYLTDDPNGINWIKKSEHNQEYVFFYSASNGRTASQNKLFHLPYSSSLKASEFESIYNMTTGLTNLAYAGCKEDGTTAPRGPGGQTKPLAAVEINEVNPYQVSTTGGGDSYLDTELADE